MSSREVNKHSTTGIKRSSTAMKRSEAILQLHKGYKPVPPEDIFKAKKPNFMEYGNFNNVRFYI